MSRRNDAGLTLVELIIASAIGLLVLTMIGGFMISSFQVQHQVTSTAQATNNAQLTATILDAQLREASAIRLENGSSSDSQLLIARVRVDDEDGNTEWRCEAWYYDAEAGAILTATASGHNQWPWGHSITSWIDLGSGLLEVVDLGAIIGDTLDWLFGGGSSTTPWTVMAVGLSNATGADGASQPVFVSEGLNAVTVRFAVESADRTPVVITTAVAGRQDVRNDGPQCF